MRVRIERIAHDLKQNLNKLGTTSLEDLELHELRPLVDIVQRQLATGTGFVVIKGFPTQTPDEESLAKIAWKIASLLGRLLPQNENNDYVYRVADERTPDSGMLFTSKTNAAIDWHTDAGYLRSIPDCVGLFTIRRAATGGMTRLASASSLYNAFMQERPHELQRLFEPYYYYRSGSLHQESEPVAQVPIFWWQDQCICVRYNRQRIEHGHVYKGIRLKHHDIRALDCFEDFLETRSLCIEFHLEEGDFLFSNNFRILHARTAFVDAEADARLLYRLWIQQDFGIMPE